MSEPGGQETPEEKPLDREDIVLAQAEIKALLLPVFSYTPLQELFSENAINLEEVRYRGLRNDFMGTRNVSSTNAQSRAQGVDERELYVYLKSAQRRKKGVDVGSLIRLVEPGSQSSRGPVIEFLTIEYAGGFRAAHAPNTQSTVNSALDLARSIGARPPS